MERVKVVAFGLVWAALAFAAAWWLWTWIGSDPYAEFQRTFEEDAEFGDKLSAVVGLALFIGCPLWFGVIGLRMVWVGLTVREDEET